jgi:hypothetical protein
MTLVVTYAPHDDESGLGYYRRLTADNALSNWRELAAVAGVQRNRGALLAHPEYVAGQLGLEREWARFAGSQEADCRSWGRLHRVSNDAVCPTCLTDEPYLRHHWQHTYVTACPLHRIRLVDRCDACGELLSANRYHVDRCDCGHDLGMLPRVASTSAQHWLSSLIASGGKQSGGTAPNLRGVSVIALVQIVGSLSLFADPTLPPPRRSAAQPRSIDEAVELLAPLESLLADWPVGFKSHVEMRIAAGNPDARTLNTLLGPWYASLRKHCQGSALEPFLRVIIEVAAVHFDGTLGLDAAQSLVAETTEYLRLSEVAKLLGLSVSRMHSAIHGAQCQHRTRRFGTRGQLYEIPRGEVERIRARRHEWVSIDQACELAGVPRSVLEHMMSAGVIALDINWRKDLLKAGQVEQSSVHELVERIRAAAQTEATPDGDKLTWAGLTSRRMGDRQAIQSLMLAIATGEVKAVAVGRRLGDMAFRRTDVTPYFGTPLLESGMSIQALSRLTGWKWESISNWIELGLLQSQSIVLRGQPCRVVLPHQVLAFRQTYMPLADLAQGMGTKSSALSRLLSGIELVGALQLPSGASRGGLIRMSELGQLAVLGARAGHDLFVPASVS